jgi:hypothetical protein
MADNIAVKDATGTSRTIGTRDVAGVHLQKFLLCRADGTVLDPSAAPADSWAAGHEPAVNTKATVTIAAPGAGKRLVVTGLTATIAADAAPAAVKVSVRLIEDAAGTPTVRLPMVLGLQAVAGAMAGGTRPCFIVALAQNTSMTLEFSAAGGANTYEAVALEGYTIAE